MIITPSLLESLPLSHVQSAQSGEVLALLQAGKSVDALKAVLSGAPVGNKNQQEKVSSGGGDNARLGTGMNLLRVLI